MAIDPQLQVIISVAVTGLTTWYATSSGNRLKQRELARDEQGAFMKTIVEEMDKLKKENEDVWSELEKVRDDLRAMKADNVLLERNNAELLRVLNRVSACNLSGCQHAARAGEFFTNANGGNS